LANGPSLRTAPVLARLIAGLGWRSRFAVALGVLVLGVLVRHYLAGMDERFFRASLHGAEGLVRYTVGDYAGAARAYRAHDATGYEPLPGLPSVPSLAAKRSSSHPKDVQALLTEGEAALARNDLNEAQEIYSRVLATWPWLGTANTTGVVSIF